VTARGHFLQTDPTPGGSANAYDYANQDPSNNYDLDGRQYVADPGGAGGGFDPTWCNRQGFYCPGTANYKFLMNAKPIANFSYPARCLVGGGLIAGKKLLTKKAAVFIGGKVVGKLFTLVAVFQTAQCFWDANPNA
jgi:hypothetical protein